MSVRERLNAAAAERILLTDGAFGTEIQNWKLAEADYAGGVREFHFYTLNRAELSYAICHLLGLRPGSDRNDRRCAA